jgi:hypothetical protein
VHFDRWRQLELSEEGQDRLVVFVFELDWKGELGEEAIERHASDRESGAEGRMS